MEHRSQIARGVCLFAGLVLCAGAGAAQDARFDARPAFAATSPPDALGLADLDGDGDLDAVGAVIASGSIVWYENNCDADPGFPIEHTVSGSLVAPRVVAAGDLDGDGDTDLAAAGSLNTSRVVWFENLGGLPPVFAERDLDLFPNLESSGIVRAAEVADLDGDGDLDVVCGFDLPVTAASGHVTVYLNDGNINPGFTRFQLPTPSLSANRVTDLVVAEVNGDTSPDIVAVSSHPAVGNNADSVLVYANTGGQSPGFVPSVIASGLGDPASVVAARLNPDALPELAVAEPANDRVLVFVNSAVNPGSFSFQQAITAVAPSDLASGALAAGFRTDLLAGTPDGPVLIENLGGIVPSFATSLLDPTPGGAHAVAAGQIDRDTDLDIAAVSSVAPFWVERVVPIQNITSGSDHASLADAVAAVGAGDELVIDAEHFTPDAILPAAGTPYDIQVIGDFDLGPRASLQADADLTVAVDAGNTIGIRGALGITPGAALTLESQAPVRVEQGQSLGNAEILSPSSELVLELRPTTLVTEIHGDFSSAAAAITEPRDVRAFFPVAGSPAHLVASTEAVGGGLGPFPGSLVLFAPDTLAPSGFSATPIDDVEAGTHQSVAVGDLDRDGLDDVASVFVPANGDPPELRAHLSDGSSPPGFTTLPVLGAQSAGGHVIFDLNRDGLADIVTPTGYYAQAPGFAFTFVSFPQVANDRGLGVAIARLNADFEPDVVVHTARLTGVQARATGYRLVALTADGLGGFTPVVIDSLDRSSDPACVGDCYPEQNVTTANLNTLSAIDLDHDGDDDVVLGEDGGLTVYENAAGAFNAIFSQNDLTWCESVAADPDGDGVIDLVVASASKSAVLSIENPIVGSGVVSELVRPVERACAIDASDVDGDDDTDLVFAGSAFDRIDLIRVGADGTFLLDGPGSALRGPGEIELVRGTLALDDGTADTGGLLKIRPGASVVGKGTILGSVFNGGVIAPRPQITVNGDYVQFDADTPAALGSLDVLIAGTGGVPLAVSSSAALAGDVRVDAIPGFTLGPQAETLIEAQQFDPAFSAFTTTLVPRLPVDLGGQTEPGLGMVAYGSAPGVDFAEIVPQPYDEPPIDEATFSALAIPADAVIGDLVGGPNGGPDGIPDLVIAYPALSDSGQGGVELLAGVMTEGGCDFQPLGTYTGKFVDGPVAVEIGDYDGDGLPEVAFGNRGDAFAADLAYILEANSLTQTPLFESTLPPVPLARDRRITDMATITLAGGPNARGPAPATLLTLSSGGVAGTATAATYSVGIMDWEVCDIDVCDDPDSFDPIDPDGAAALLGEGFTSTSTDDDKVLVASNTGGMPDTFPLESFSAGLNPTEIRAEDLNDDGFPDIAAINETSGTVSVFVNTANAGSPGGRSFDVGVEWTLLSDPGDPDPQPGSIALADLDDDGDLDIAVVSTDGSGARAVRFLTNLLVETGSLSFSLPENLPTQPADTPVLVREFDAGVTGTALNDDLVVLTEPAGGTLRAAGIVGGGGFHAILCSQREPCLPDVNGDGELNPADFNAWILAYNSGDIAADQNQDGQIDPSDFNAWILNFNAGC